MVHSTEQGLKLQLLAAALIAALVFLHYLLWIDENGVRQTHTLRISIRAQTEENAELAESNRGLAAEIEDLKRGLMAIEERARSDMGMIRQDETFYRLLEKSQPPRSSKSTPPAKLPPVQLPPPAAKPALLPAKPSAQAAKPASAAKPPAPAAKPGSPASTAKPAPPVKPQTPTAKPTPPAKPQTPTAKPTPPAKPSAPASIAKPTPPAKPQTPTAKPTPTPGASQRRE
jgi:cell division protein FtsB